MKDINSLTKEELIALRDDVDAAIDACDKRQREKALAAARKAAADHGFNLENLIGTKPTGSAPRKVAPKYRHPTEPEKTWAGRGRRPKWLEEELAKGLDLENFAID